MLTLKVLQSMSLGQSLLVEGREYVKTKKGFYTPAGNKYTQKWIVEKFFFSAYEIM